MLEPSLWLQPGGTTAGTPKRRGGRSAARRSAKRTNPTLERLEDRTVPTLLGQQLFPADNPWNQNIANAPVAANSAAVIANIGASTRVTPNWYADNPGNGASPLYGMPINVVHGNSVTRVNVTIDNYPWESDVVPVPIPANAGSLVVTYPFRPNQLVDASTCQQIVSIAGNTVTLNNIPSGFTSGAAYDVPS